VLVCTAALVAWYAVRRDAPPAPRPAELFDEAARAASSWSRPDTLERGETLDVLLRRGGLDAMAVRDILGAAPMVDPRRLREGTALEFVADSVGAPTNEVVIKLAIDHRVRLVRSPAGGWTATEERLPWITDTVVVRGEIPKGGSLWTAFSELTRRLFPGDVGSDLISKVATVYAYRIDMSTELQPGDSVYALVERARGPESHTRVRNVLAARLEVGGRPYEAFKWVDERSQPKYYDGVGKSMVTTFLRSPLDFPRITSVFSLNRRHPILRTWRAHRGTDYGAASGTEVRAIADGRVVRAIYNPGGYGFVVDIAHSNNITTRYAHLRAFAQGIRAGTQVRQREVIGYVGATGLATAPHLHFEVLLRGVQQDPRFALPRTDGKPLPANEKPQFDRTRDILLALLGQSEGVVRPAENP
jgi:murein DD-endopeptidase MepM/ murein hydrolase activator NlpD